MHLRGFLIASVVCLAAATADAQVKRQTERVGGDTAVVEFTLPDGKKASAPAAVLLDSMGTPIGAAAKQETAQLVTGNVTSPAVSVFGGTYILTQLCTGYGTVAFRYRAPDGSTMVTLMTKSAADSGGGTALQLGSGQVVDVTLTSTTGCNVTLSRVP